MRTLLLFLLTIGTVHGQYRLTTQDNAFLDSLERDTFRYFWETANPSNGLIPDRAPTPSFSSIAAVGFGLTTYLVGVERGYISRKQAAERTLATLRFFAGAAQSDKATGVSGYKGFFYHFLDMKTGERFKQVELSTIDTALLLGGVLSSQTYFDTNTPAETEIRKLAEQIYARVDWVWFQNKRGSTSRPFISMGWHPEKGFIPNDWTGYNEGMLLYVLALGSPTHPVGPEVWTAWTKSYEWATFQGQSLVNFDPLFGHQYSHTWIDFRGIQDAYMRGKGIDYAENSRRATYANRAYCVANPAKWQDYGHDDLGPDRLRRPQRHNGGGSKFLLLPRPWCRQSADRGRWYFGSHSRRGFAGLCARDLSACPARHENDVRAETLRSLRFPRRLQPNVSLPIGLRQRLHGQRLVRCGLPRHRSGADSADGRKPANELCLEPNEAQPTHPARPDAGGFYGRLAEVVPSKMIVGHCS